MLRTILIALFALLSASIATARDPVRQKYVDLNAPNAMEKIQASNPNHYAKIQRIVDGLNERSLREVPRWINAEFKAKDVFYSDIMLVSLPGQRRLGFTLDGTTYGGVVTMESPRAVIYPIKSR